jgi:hypothetical protein
MKRSHVFVVTEMQLKEMIGMDIEDIKAALCAARCVADRFNEPALVLDSLQVIRESEAPKGQVYLERVRPCS